MVRQLAPVLVALLAGNAVYFAVAGTASKAIDAAAWLFLLLLFLAETQFRQRLQTPRARLIVRTLRLAAGAGVVAATLGYIIEGNALDAVNRALWIGVVVLLEIQLRWPGAVARARRTFSAASLVLYGSLGALILLWAARGEWFDAYDGALWLVAFATLEVEASRKG